MKRPLLPFIFLVLLSSIKGQTQLAGKYRFYANPNWLPYYIVILNCDHSFLAVDSLNQSKVMGTWSVREKKLIVSVRPTVFNPKENPAPAKVKFLISGDMLYVKIESKRKYKKETRQWSREMPEAPDFEDYEKFKERQDSRYLKRIESFNCK